jgi:Tol biopolymer transport system component/DNA-binding winged helix-turn-helix (wHTH) protein
MSPVSVYQINQWTLHVGSGDLRCDDEQHRLPPRLARLLSVLVSEPGRVWRRDELLDAVWEQRVVNEEALSRAISQLRQLLKDKAGDPAIIATVPKVGYRCVAEVRCLSDEVGLPELMLPAINASQPIIPEAAGPEIAKPEITESETIRPAPVAPEHAQAEPLNPAENEVHQRRSLLWLLIIAAFLASALMVAMLLLWTDHESDHPDLATGDAFDLSFSAKRMTATPGLEHFVALSPDGLQMAYVAVVEPGTDDARYAVHLLSTQDNDQSRVIDAGVHQLSPVFSPDGTHIAVAEVDGDRCEVVVLALFDETRRRLGPCELQGLLPILDWSADGSQLAVSAAAEHLAASAIWFIDLNDGSREQITRPADAYHSDARPRFSPDGRYLSFSRGTPAYREIYLLELAANHAARALTHDHQFTVSHDWLPSGEAIIFDSDRSGERGLWRLSINATAEPVSLGARGSQYPSIASETSAVAFQVAAYEANLWRYELTEDADNTDAQTEVRQAAHDSGRVLVPSTKYESNPAISPDGQWLAFVSNRSGRGALWRSSLSGDKLTKLYEPESGRASWPVWNVDGSALFFVHYQEGGQWLSRLDLASLTVTRLDLPHQGFALSVSADGQWLIYSALLAGKGVQIWRLPADLSAAPEAITEVGVQRAYLAQDQQLYLMYSDQAGIYRRALLDPQDEALVVAEQDASQWQNWFLQNNSLYFLKRRQALPGDEGEAKASPLGVWEYQLDSGQRVLRKAMLPTALGPNLAISPDGRTLILAMTDRAEADLFYYRSQQKTLK